MVQPEFLHDQRHFTRGKLRIAESFVSRQGEGKLTGTPSFFIRTSGCNLRCHFCDTPYASWRPEGEIQGVPELLLAAQATGLQHVVVTGGEPLIAASVGKLCGELRSLGMHVTIETAGTVDVPVECDLLSLSPKLRGSAPDPKHHPRWHAVHEARRMPIGVMRRLIQQAVDHQLKFVIESSEDFSEVQAVVARLGVEPAEVWIMPEGTTVQALDDRHSWLRPWAESNGYRYCDRMQIRWYGNRRGT